MQELIQLVEYASQDGGALNVDSAQGIIRGVRILGLVSRNGRRYTPEAAKNAIGMYEGAKVNVNHQGPNERGARGYEDRMGVLRNVAFRDGAGLYADYHYNPKHSLAEQLAWDAKNAPRNVGFSHNAEGKGVRKDGGVVIEAITAVHSVDLVADPATTNGLFEHYSGDEREQHLTLGEALDRENFVIEGKLPRHLGHYPKREVVVHREIEESRSPFIEALLRGF